MILKLINGKIHSLGEGTLTDFHASRGYIEVPTEDIQFQDNGSLYEFYLVDSNGKYVPDFVSIAADDFKKIVTTGEDIVKNHVQKVVKDFNEAHGTTFENVYNCAVYKDISGYTNQQFCIDILAFNAEVWDKSRAIQKDIVDGTITIPTDEEFIAMLPVYSGTV